MATIIPFHGMRYDTTVVGEIKQVVAPPYDIIDASGQKALHDRHPQNIIRLELGLDQPGDSPTHNRYTRAASTLRDWLKSGALKRDAQPTLYYHTIEYTPPYASSGSPTKTLKGILAAVKLEALDSGHIYPHENTRSAAKTDRLNLLEACKSNFSPIWSLYSDPQGAVMSLLEGAVKGKPASIDFRDDVGFRQQLWAVTDPAVLEHAVDALRNKPLFIADGHHRYETALNYQKLRRQQAGSPAGQHPYDGVLMLLTALEDPGLTVLPTHRVTTTASAFLRPCAIIVRPHVRPARISVHRSHADGHARKIYRGDADDWTNPAGIRAGVEGRQPLRHTEPETGPSSARASLSARQARCVAAPTTRRHDTLSLARRTRGHPLYQG